LSTQGRASENHQCVDKISKHGSTSPFVVAFFVTVEKTSELLTAKPSKIALITVTAHREEVNSHILIAIIILRDFLQTFSPL
jgi:hypothetical protein